MAHLITNVTDQQSAQVGLDLRFSRNAWAAALVHPKKSAWSLNELCVSKPQDVDYYTLRVHLVLVEEYARIGEQLFNALSRSLDTRAPFTRSQKPCTSELHSGSIQRTNPTHDASQDVFFKKATSYPLVQVLQILDFIQYSSDDRRIAEAFGRGDLQSNQNTWGLYEEAKDRVKTARERLQRRFLQEGAVEPSRHSTLPIESLLELAIQCVLDNEPNIALQDVQQLLRDTFSNLSYFQILSSLGIALSVEPSDADSIIGAPPVIFISATNEGRLLHVGGSKPTFSPPQKINALAKVTKSYGKDREALLTEINGSTDLLSLHKSIVCGSSGKYHSKAELDDQVELFRNRATNYSRAGQAFFPLGFEPVGPCGKCRTVQQFQFVNDAGKVDAMALKLYPALACAEDAWELKRRLGFLK